MAENRRGRGPYYFTRGQLVLLALGFTASSVIIFLLGILIGKGIEERKLLKKEEPLVKVPIQPMTGSKSGVPSKDDMTFYETLAKTRTATQVAEESQAAEKGTKSEAKETQSLSARDGKEKAEKTPSAPEIKKQAPAQKTQREVASPENAKRDGAWTVQVNAYGNETDAKALAKKLKDKGYDSYVTFATIKGRAWYRVRVGRFETREQAQALQETLKQKEDLSNSITMSR